jgi:multiple sugar transport system permease protein
MSDTIITSGSDTVPETVTVPKAGLFAGRQGRKLREALLAYIFLLPAFLIIFTFGIFPLAFSVYQSTLKGLNKIVGTYDGIGNYVKALGNLAYVLGFWIAFFCLFWAVRSLVLVWREARERQDKPWWLLLPAGIMTTGIVLFITFFFRFLPEVLLIANAIRTAKQGGAQESTSELFRQFLFDIFVRPQMQQALWTSMGVLLLSGVITYVVFRAIPHSPRNSHYFGSLLQTILIAVAGTALLWFVWTSVQLAYSNALENGEELQIWAQTVTISAGFVLLGLSWVLWRSANSRSSNLSMAWRLVTAMVLIAGAWLLIAELPLAAAGGDKDWFQGLLNTFYYSAGSIPFQFAISLMLATFLFQNIRGKTAFRMIYFLPYITPAVGAAAVFRILFSGRVDAPINRIITALGMQPLGWLNEPTGIFQMIVGSNVDLPAWAVGPSLSLVVIIIFGIWTFVGFNTVIFLAGLGAIPSELYEAASIDGGSRWAQFRHITLPLLSPTIYFLTLYAVIGTFKAFTHIFVLRTPAALGTADTASVVIFDAIKRDTRYGYAAALAVLLLIIVLLLTAVNNRIASKRVFYG